MSERELLRKAAQTDPVARGAYADWLDEHGEPLLASLYRMSPESLSEMKGLIMSAATEMWLPDAFTAAVNNIQVSMGTPVGLLADGIPTHNSYEYAQRMRELTRDR